ncbi:hypothetical protein HYU06_00515 [Candidatus Woesearchaeota archaeon]|nr:hypothetical protein [Candidatus Woesearchaeota archaeon]
MNKEPKTDSISVDKFIDLIIGGRGEQIKKDLREIEKKKHNKAHKC